MIRQQEKGLAEQWSAVARRIRVPAGFLFAAFFLWRARPSPESLAWSLLLVVPGLLLRAIASGHVQKNAVLTTSGPYTYTRNPLYLGSLLAACGFAVASRSLLIVVLLAILFALLYGPTMLAEEKFLRAAFPGYEAYARSVPRLIPRFRANSPRSAVSGHFCFERYRKHREYNAVLGACFIYAILIVRMALDHGWWLGVRF